MTDAGQRLLAWLQKHYQLAGYPLDKFVAAIEAEAAQEAPDPDEHSHGGQPCDPSEAAAIAAEPLNDPLATVLAYRASPPEYPGLALVPVPDLDRLDRARKLGLYPMFAAQEAPAPEGLRLALRQMHEAYHGRDCRCDIFGVRTLLAAIPPTPAALDRPDEDAIREAGIGYHAPGPDGYGSSRR